MNNFSALYFKTFARLLILLATSSAYFPTDSTTKQIVPTDEKPMIWKRSARGMQL